MAHVDHSWVPTTPPTKRWSREQGPRPVRTSRSASRYAVATAKAPGTCGELVQGVLNGHDFLITSPIDLYSVVTVTLCGGSDVRAVGTECVDKTIRAVTAFIRGHGYEGGATVHVSNSLPRGKGLASSTADITAGVHAAAEALGINVPAYKLSEIAVGVEPSDGLFYRGVVIYDQIRGEILEPLGDPPPIRIFIVDGGGTVETLGFDRERHRAAARKHAELLERAVNLVRQGFRLGLPALIGEGATLSTHYHQEVHEKALVPDLLDLCARTGGIGVNVGHSGTVCGVMYDPRHCADAEVLAALAETVGPHRLLGVHQLIGGGSRVVKGSMQGVGEAQQAYLALFGEPTNRVEHSEGNVLEFDHPSRPGVHFYAFPDGSLHLEHPDPSQGMAPRPNWRRPKTGELWEMRVRIVGRTESEVRYLPDPCVAFTVGSVRVLPRYIFEDSFAVDGDEAVRRVKIMSCARDTVSYQAQVRPVPKIPEDTSSLGLPIFLANYQPVL